MTTVTLGTESEKPASSSAHAGRRCSPRRCSSPMSTAGCWRSPGRWSRPSSGLSATAFGLAVSAFFWVYAPAQLLCGWMVDRFSVYRLFAGGVGLFGVATVLLGAVGGLTSLVAIGLMLGLGQSFAFPGSSKMIARHCGAQEAATSERRSHGRPRGG